MGREQFTPYTFSTICCGLNTTNELEKKDSVLNAKLKLSIDRFFWVWGHSNVQTVSRLAAGRPSVKIVDFASKDHFDLIGMGTAGLRGIDRYHLGSTTNRVLSNSDIPVLVTRFRDGDTSDC